MTTQQAAAIFPNFSSRASGCLKFPMLELLIVLDIITLLAPCLIALFVLVCLNEDYRHKHEIQERFKAACDRAARRDEMMHPGLN